VSTRVTHNHPRAHTHTHTHLHTCMCIKPASCTNLIRCNVYACMWVVLSQVPVDRIVEKEKIVEVEVPVVTKVFQVLVP